MSSPCLFLSHPVRLVGSNWSFSFTFHPGFNDLSSFSMIPNSKFSCLDGILMWHQPVLYDVDPILENGGLLFGALILPCSTSTSRLSISSFFPDIYLCSYHNVANLLVIWKTYRFPNIEKGVVLPTFDMLFYYMQFLQSVINFFF